MPDIPMRNETGYDLTPFILEQIKSEAIEHFGEWIDAIRVQLGIARHAFNIKTREVRFAFSPLDYDFSKPTIPPAETATYQPGITSLHDDEDDADLMLSDYVDDIDKTAFAMLDNEIEISVNDDEPMFQALDPDFDVIETVDLESLSSDDNEFEPH